MSKTRKLLGVMLALAMTWTVGCDTDDARLVRLSEQSSARQAEQNQQIARQSHETTQATRDLVAADAKARTELLQAQRTMQAELQAERGRLDARRETLDRQQQDVIAAEQRAPIVAEAILVIGTLLVCLLPLAVCGYLLRTVQSDADSVDLTELLAQEFIGADTLLVVQSEPVISLPAPDESRLDNDATQPH
jgi:hypothetical protein